VQGSEVQGSFLVLGLGFSVLEPIENPFRPKALPLRLGINCPYSAQNGPFEGGSVHWTISATG
jgi:hypothetical protein